MEDTFLTRARLIALVVLLSLSVSAWTGAPVTVLAAPSDGIWTGTTSRGFAVSFTVSGGGTQWNNFTLKTNFDFGSCSGTVTTTLIVGTISGDQFSGSSSTFSFTGQFSGSGSASGTYSYSGHNTGCGTLNQTGTWTAQTSLSTEAPGDGNWTGTTSRGRSVTFVVSGGGTQWSSFALTTDFNVGFCSGTLTQTLSTPGAITNNQFGRTSGDFTFAGQFNTPYTATGTYSFKGLVIPNCGNLYQSGTWTASIPAPTFSDVSFSYWAHDFIEQLYNAGITGGCGVSPLRYCPEGVVTRAQMAVFLLRGIHGSAYAPPAVGGSTGFGDVPTAYWAAPFIKQLAVEGITSGCGNGNYCPEGAVNRAQMAVFLLRAKYGSAYTPPDVGGGTGFGDVATTYWAAPFIKQLVAEGITVGCGGGNYCPEGPVTRAQMAVFLVRTFNLP